jgi:hypothetical protein
MDIRIVKAKRCLRKVPRVAAARFVEPIFNSGQILAFLASVVGLAIILRLGASAHERDMLANQWAIAVEAFAIALVGWGAISLIMAPFVVVREERRKGRWVGHHFIYNEPILVATERFESTHTSTQQREIVFSDAEPNSFVYYDCRLVPPAEGMVLAIVRGGPPHPSSLLPSPREVRWGHFNNGARLPADKQATLLLRMRPGTVPVVCRVYCQSFFVGKDDKAPA